MSDTEKDPSEHDESCVGSDQQIHVEISQLRKDVLKLREEHNKLQDVVNALKTPCKQSDTLSQSVDDDPDYTSYLNVIETGIDAIRNIIFRSGKVPFCEISKLRISDVRVHQLFFSVFGDASRSLQGLPLESVLCSFVLAATCVWGVQWHLDGHYFENQSFTKIFSNCMERKGKLSLRSCDMRLSTNVGKVGRPFANSIKSDAAVQLTKETIRQSHYALSRANDIKEDFLEHVFPLFRPLMENRLWEVLKGELVDILNKIFLSAINMQRKALASGQKIEVIFPRYGEAYKSETMNLRFSEKKDRSSQSYSIQSCTSFGLKRQEISKTTSCKPRENPVFQIIRKADVEICE